MGNCYSQANFISNIKIRNMANATIKNIKIMSSSDWERAQWKSQWVYQQPGKCQEGGAKKNQNSPFFRYFFSYQTLNTKLLREKRKRFLSKITLNHYVFQKNPLNILYYMHMWVTLEKNVTFTGCLFLWQTIDDSVIHGNKHLLNPLWVRHQMQKQCLQDTVSASQGTHCAVKKQDTYEAKAALMRC